MDPTGFNEISLIEIPRDQNGNVLVDIYIRLPSQERYVRFVAAGDAMDAHKENLIQGHVEPKAYISKSSKPAKEADLQEQNITVEKMVSGEFQREVLGKQAEAELNLMFKQVFSGDVPPEESFKVIEGAAEKILNTVAPETKALKEYLLNNIKNIELMNDISAITSIAVMVAFANGFDSQKSYRDLSYACLVMDAGMSEFSTEEINQYYQDMEGLKPETLAKFKKHPARSHDLAAEKLKSLSDVTMQLILSHHELFNGRGYPRGTRTESQMALVKILAFAVDIFEKMKKADLNGKPMTLPEAVLELRELKVEAHLKRHSKKLVDSVMKLLNVEEQPA